MAELGLALLLTGFGIWEDKMKKSWHMLKFHLMLVISMHKYRSLIAPWFRTILEQTYKTRQKSKNLNQAIDLMRVGDVFNS